MNDRAAVVLYDGVCGFCNASVQFIIKRDPKKRFRFAPLQSETGRKLAAQHRIDADRLDGLVLVENGVALVKSTAALTIARHLRLPWPAVAVFLIVPRGVRDWLYDRFAARRYRWFGKVEACVVPTPENRERFLDFAMEISDAVK